VLFADLKGSIELLADRDPEEARQLLYPILELMMDAVHRYEGTGNQARAQGGSSSSPVVQPSSDPNA
jgi:class 3 adenylate cyclase